MGAPDFSKNWTIVLNFHAKIINTLIPVCQQTTKKWYVKRSCSANYIFTTQHDFQTCFDKKKCSPAIDDFKNLQTHLAISRTAWCSRNVFSLGALDMNKTFVNLLKLFTLARILGLFSVSQLFLTNRYWTFIDVSDDFLCSSLAGVSLLAPGWIKRKSNIHLQIRIEQKWESWQRWRCGRAGQLPWKTQTGAFVNA